MATLTADDVRFYRENGDYVYHLQVFSDEKLDRLRAIFEEPPSK